jgi:hypothetical protein
LHVVAVRSSLPSSADVELAHQVARELAVPHVRLAGRLAWLGAHRVDAAVVVVVVVGVVRVGLGERVAHGQLE